MADVDRRIEYSCPLRHFWDTPAILSPDESYARSDGLSRDEVRCPECGKPPKFQWEAFSFIAVQVKE